MGITKPPLKNSNEFEIYEQKNKKYEKIIGETGRLIQKYKNFSAKFLTKFGGKIMGNLLYLAEALEYTGYTDVDKFSSEEEVREFFTAKNFIDSIGEYEYHQDELDEFANYVIRHKLHCDF